MHLLAVSSGIKISDMQLTVIHMRYLPIYFYLLTFFRLISCGSFGIGIGIRLGLGLGLRFGCCLLVFDRKNSRYVINRPPTTKATSLALSKKKEEIIFRNWRFFFFFFFFFLLIIKVSSNWKIYLWRGQQILAGFVYFSLNFRIPDFYEFLFNYNFLKNNSFLLKGLIDCRDFQIDRSITYIHPCRPCPRILVLVIS